MIIADFDIEGVAVDVPKTDAPLIIDRNGVLALAIALQRVQPIPRGHPEIVEPPRQIQVLQFSDSTSRDIRREAFGRPVKEEIAGPAIGERLDHGEM